MKIRSWALALLLTVLASQPVWSEWVWTKETGWVNTKNIERRSVEEIYDDAKAAFAAQNYESSYRDFRLLATYIPDERYTEEALFYTAESLYFIGRYNAAWGYYNTYMEIFPGSDRTNDIIDRLHTIGKAFLEGRRKDIELPYGLQIRLWSDREMGTKILNHIIDFYPYSKISDEVQMTVATYYHESGQHAEALKQYEKLLDLYLSSPLREYAMFRIGVCYFDWYEGKKYTHEMLPKADAAFKDYMRVYEPQGGHYVADARNYLTATGERLSEKIFSTGDYYQRTGAPTAAITYYKRVLREYPDTSWAAKCQERIDRLADASAREQEKKKTAREKKLAEMNKK